MNDKQRAMSGERGVLSDEIWVVRGERGVLSDEIWVVRGFYHISAKRIWVKLTVSGIWLYIRRPTNWPCEIFYNERVFCLYTKK